MRPLPQSFAKMSAGISLLILASIGVGQERNPQVARAVGVVKSVQSGLLMLTSDAGGEIAVTLAESTKLLRVEPGQTDLKNATAIQAHDLQPGDRVLVRGQGSADGHSINALAVIVMKQADVSAQQQRDREDWQKRGVGGLVSGVDAAAGTVTISAGGFGTNRKVLVRTTKSTVIRRYAPESVKFDDARPSTIDQVKDGDQLRARGTRSADGNELEAQEIVFGTFRNIVGTITEVDAANNTLSVQDAIARSVVVVRVTADSQIRKLPAEFAQRIAMRLKASNGEAGGQAASAAPTGASAPGNARPGGMGGNGSPDFQRFLNRIPGGTLADLQKGDAVMIVSTMGNGSGPVTGITMLAGVEPILSAAPNRNTAMMLSPWTLGAGGGEGEAGPQ